MALLCQSGGSLLSPSHLNQVRLSLVGDGVCQVFSGVRTDYYSLTANLEDVFRENIQSGVKQKVQKKLLEALVLLDYEAERCVSRENSVQQQSPEETSRRRTFVLLRSIRYSSSGSG